MVVWSSALRSIVQPGLTRILSKPGAVQTIVQNGKHIFCVQIKWKNYAFYGIYGKLLVMQSNHRGCLFDINLRLSQTNTNVNKLFN